MRKASETFHDHRWWEKLGQKSGKSFITNVICLILKGMCWGVLF